MNILQGFIGCTHSFRGCSSHALLFLKVKAALRRVTSSNACDTAYLSLWDVVIITIMTIIITTIVIVIIDIMIIRILGFDIIIVFACSVVDVIVIVIVLLLIVRMKYPLAVFPQKLLITGTLVLVGHFRVSVWFNWGLVWLQTFYLYTFPIVPIVYCRCSWLSRHRMYSNLLKLRIGKQPTQTYSQKLRVPKDLVWTTTGFCQRIIPKVMSGHCVKHATWGLGRWTRPWQVRCGWRPFGALDESGDNSNGLVVDRVKRQKQV